MRIRKIAFLVAIGFLFTWISLRGQSCINFSTYFGRANGDDIKSVCSDPHGNIYVLGNTYNSDLPITPGAFQSILKGSYDGFLAKFDSCGNLIWSTYFGSSGFDNAEKIIYSGDNSIVFCGYTDGPDLSTTGGCFQSAKKGSEDCFIAKFSLSGSPQWITYFGAAAGDFAFDVKTDSLNNIVIGGTSLSDTLYTTASSFQQTMAGSTDAFIARFSPSGNLRFSTFYGGSGPEDIHALAIDKNCNIIGVGGTFSSNLITSPSCYQSVNNGGMEIYVMKLDSLGQLVFSTYIGAPGTDDAYGACTDNANYIYVSGHTNSAAFYTSPGAFQSGKSLGNDAYCLSLSPGGTMLWSTFLGGTGQDFMARMHINTNKELVLLVNSQSTDFPMPGSSSSTVNTGGQDAVVMKLLTNGTPFWSTYLGGSLTDTGNDLVSINKTKIVIAGKTVSSDFPVNGNIYQNTFAGTDDGFLTVLSSATSTLASVNEINPSSCANSFYDSERSEIKIGENCNGKYFFRITDILGRLYKEGDSWNGTINVWGLDQGLYIIYLIDSSNDLRTRFRFFKD